MPEITFSKGFINPNPASSSDASDDDGDEDDDDLPYERLIRSRESEMNKNLDFHNRYDPAPYKETPFTRAIINGSRRSETPQEDNRPQPATGNGWIVRLAGSTKPSSKPIQNSVRSGGSIPVSNPDPGGRYDTSRHPGKVFGALKKDEKPPAKKSAWGGWTSKGVPVISAAPKKSMAQTADEMMAKENGKKKGKAKNNGEGTGKNKAPTRSKTTSTSGKGKGKGKQKEEENNEGKIVFGRIRAGPTSKFPIVQGLEKQKKLPVNKRAAPFPPIDIRDESDDEQLPSLDILFSGVAEEAEKEMKAAEQKTQARAQQEGRISNVQTKVPMPSSHHISSKSQPIDDKADLSDVILLSDDDDLPSDIAEPEVEEPTDSVIREQTRQMAVLRDKLMAENAELQKARNQAQQNDNFSTPSTITRVASPPADSKIYDSSSSALPYSSPLERYNYENDYVNPQPARPGYLYQNHVDMLERMVEPANGWNTTMPRSFGPAPSYTAKMVPHHHIHPDSAHLSPSDDPFRASWDGSQSDNFASENQGRLYIKRELSPDTPPPVPEKRHKVHTAPRLAKIHRRLATVKPYRPESPEDMPAVREEWNTLGHVRSRTSAQPSINVKSSGPFRLPIQAFQTNQTLRSSFSKAPTSVHSAKANWFRPTPPSRHNNISDNRPVFVTEAKALSEQDGFHDRLKASVGLKGQARDYLQDSSHPRLTPASPFTSSQTRFDLAEEDWRDAWSRKTPRHNGSSFSNFAYDQPVSHREQTL